MPAQGAPAVRKERHGDFYLVKSKHFSDSEGRLGLDLTMILKEWQ